MILRFLLLVYSYASVFLWFLIALLLQSILAWNIVIITLLKFTYDGNYWPSIVGSMKSQCG